MMNKFREIYDSELEKRDESTLEQSILNHSSVRAFVYEVCKRVTRSELEYAKAHIGHARSCVERL